MALIEITALALAALVVVLGLLVIRERKSRLRFRILAEVAAVSEAGGSLEQTLYAICAILVPEIADVCAIDVIGEDGVPRRAAVRAGPGGPPEIEQQLAERMPSMPPWMVDDEAGLEPRFYERLSDDDLRAVAHDEEDLEFLRSVGTRSAVTVALKARGEVTGALTLSVGWSGRRYRRDDAHFAWILSGRVALALDNSGLFADLEEAERARAEIAETLQRGLLPSPLPHIPGWSIAAMYRPAGAENEVGGDFYDAFRVPGGWMLVVGDVTGRGARAASITAVARYTLRTAAMLSDDPLVALQTLNRALLARGDSALCSLAAMTLSEDRFEPVRLAIAGHPPPLLIDGERVEEVAVADPVLGAFDDARWRISRCEVEPGQLLVVVTDGIAEAQGAEGRFGETRLQAHLGGATNPAQAAQRLEGSLHAFTEGSFEDDMAMIGLSRASEAAPLHAVPVVEELYDRFNARDERGIVELCDEEMEFHPVVTAEAIGREAPYRGPAGLHDYLLDVAKVWEELRLTPDRIERRGDAVLVRGRAYARSRELGIRDVPVGWIWGLRGEQIVRGEVFPDPEQAVERFASLALA
jgi:serine phosphatase RsbU (regulator of sigma subunit)/ketosteroid isomerase-like protein